MSSRISSRLFSSLKSFTWVLTMNVLDPKVPLWKRSARPTWHGTAPLRAERVVKASLRPQRVQRSNVAKKGALGCTALDGLARYGSRSLRAQKTLKRIPSGHGAMALHKPPQRIDHPWTARRSRPD